MTNSRPIGIFDSGIGGLSVANRIREILPNEHLLYIADSAHAPYGEKTEAQIIQRATSIVDFLLEKQAKAIVVACNTATAAAIKSLRAKYNVPIIGVEPGVKPAVFNTSSGVIGVLATTHTLQSTAFNDLTKIFSTHVNIMVQPCPGLMEQVEALCFTGESTQTLIKQYLQPLLDKQADNIVLGCTHYAFLTPMIKKIAGTEVNIINTDSAIAREIARRLQVEGLLSSNTEPAESIFWTSGNRNMATRQLSLLWGETVKVLQLD